MAREGSPSDEMAGPLRRVWRALFGAPRDLRDPRLFQRVSLVAFLAWVGLGADGLSSSAYGPAEAFRNLDGHWYLAVFLAAATALTVFVISYGYTRVIELFPYGGGGYAVATKLLGRQAGLVSGCALLVDYTLTITVSVAAGGDAIFNLLPASLGGDPGLKLPCEVAVVGALIVLNLRGVKESVHVVLPIFLLFLLTHAVLIAGGIAAQAPRLPAAAAEIGAGLAGGLRTVGPWGLFLVFARAFSLGAGTYTGIEAVSNGVPIMRDPKVYTARRTMAYMAASLAFVAAGLMVCYLLYRVQDFLGLPAAVQERRTLNWVLADRFAGGWRVATLPVGALFVSLVTLAEAALLFVAAQTGFLDGPRVMANMAIDSWLPRRFASLSDRLTAKDGILLLGLGAIAILVGLRGRVSSLVVLYSINVFATFSLTNLGMCRYWMRARRERPGWARHMAIHVVGLLLCVAILVIMLVEKFREGAWLTLVITGTAIAFCLLVRAHYRAVSLQLRRLDHEFVHLPTEDHHGGAPDARLPTAVLLVGPFGGVGIHSLLSIQKMFPGYFKNVVFVSVAVIDSGSFKGPEQLAALQRSVAESVARYVALARRLGWNAASVTAIGTDPVEEIYRVAVRLARDYPRVMFFGGKLIWRRESWWQRILHNETSYQVQRRLQWKGLPMTIIPLRADAPRPRLRRVV